MPLPRRQFLQLAASVAISPIMPHAGWAQSYPARPITIIVPFPAGGPTDTIARVLAEQMRGTLGQPVIVENVAGANGTVGVARAARAAPDGYTISIGHLSTHVINGAIYPLKIDLLDDFVPVAQVATNPQLIVTRNNLPANSLQELIAWLKANPDKALQATSGPGSPSHIAGAFFQRATGTRFQFVPYRGSAPMMQDLLGGQVDFIFDQAANSLPQVHQGRIKAHAVTALKRLNSAPDIPTVDEVGLPGFHVSVWHGLWVPKGTPKDIVSRLNTTVVQALEHQRVITRLIDLGQEIPSPEQRRPEALAALQKAEIEKWWPIIREAGIKAD